MVRQDRNKYNTRKYRLIVRFTNQHDDCWHSQWADKCSWAGTEANCMSSGGDPHWCGSVAVANEAEVEKQVAVEEKVADCSECTGHDDCWHSQWADKCSWAGTEANCMSSGGDPHWCGSVAAADEA